MNLLDVRVARKHAEAEGICSFELVPADPRVALPAFAPGAHIDVHVPGGWVRQYSLCNAPDEQGMYRIAVLREEAGRGGSRGMHENVPAGALLKVGTPRNQFPLQAAARKSLLLAGGIGITPIIAMAHALAAGGAAFELHYCTRSAARTAFLDRLREPRLASHVHVHHDDGGDAQRLDLAAVLAAQPADGHLYVCGPKGFMDAVLGAARASGWGEERLHFEFFQAEAVAADGNRPFEVKLASSGRVVAVPAGKTVVQALAEAGVEILTSCEQGICGTCVTRVLEGVPEHRDSFLMPHEHEANDCFTPCCSRSRTAMLVLDL